MQDFSSVGAGGGFLPAFGLEKTKGFHHRGGWVLQGHAFKQRPDLIAAGQPRWAPPRAETRLFSWKPASRAVEMAYGS